MYSRNFGTFEDLTGTLSKSQKTIPVKVFGDNAAYERFSRLGLDEEKPLRNSDASENTVAADTIIDEEKEIIIENEALNKAEISQELKGLLSLIDRDSLILILASAMILFSDETNDKITPLCLLAILLL